jgi:hypothetical protein
MKLFAAALAALTLSAPAFADQWTSADSLYAQRENNRAKIADARAAYTAILNASGAAAQDKIRAATQIGRLSYYEGEMLLAKTDTAERKKVFKACWDALDKIKPTSGANAIPATPNFYFYKGLCMAFWGEAAGTLASLPYVPTLLDMIEKGLAQDTRFEGGGIFRLAAGVYGNKKAQPLGLYQPEKALEMIEKSLVSAAFPGDANSGAKWFDNWRGKATALVELERNADAKTILTSGIAKINDLIDDDELPAGRTPETMWILSKMEEELAALN